VSDLAIIVMANERYFSQAKSLFTACVRQGNWKGDLCLLTAEEQDAAEFSSRGIRVMSASDKVWTLFTKFHVFSDYFKQWKQVLYLDCDVLIQRDLNELFQGLGRLPRSLYFDGSHDASILADCKHFDDKYGSGYDSHPERYTELREQFPHIDKLTLSADVIFFRPEDVPLDTVAALQNIGEQYLDLNPGRTDQQVMNFLLYDEMSPLTKDYCTWWAFDDPGNRVACEARGWRGDEFPYVVHYWDMYAPWLVKTPDADAYANDRLGRVCHELYAENLSLFESTFPLRP